MEEKIRISRMELYNEIQDVVPKSFVDQYDSLRKNRGVGYVIGQPGSGTLFVTKGMLMQAILGGDKVIVFDNNGDYEHIMKGLGITPTLLVEDISSIVKVDVQILNEKKVLYYIGKQTVVEEALNNICDSIYAVARELYTRSANSKPVWIFFSSLNEMTGYDYAKTRPLFDLLASAKSSNLIFYIRDNDISQFIRTFNRYPYFGNALFENVNNLIALRCDTNTRSALSFQYHLSREHSEMVGNADPGCGIIKDEMEFKSFKYRYPMGLISYKFITNDQRYDFEIF